MRRREFIFLLSSAAVTWPFRAHAQQLEKIHRVGFLGPNRATSAPEVYQAFSSQLEKNGFRKGQNIILTIAPSKIRAAHLSARQNWCVLSRICWLPLAQRSPCKQS